MEGTNGIGLGDAMLLAQNGNNSWGGGGCFFWVIILFWLMAGGGAWGNNRNYATQQDVYAAQQNTQLENSIRGVAQQNTQLGYGIADATFALNNTVNNGFTGVMRDNFALQNTMMGGFNNLAQAVNENRFAAQQCCCELGRAIDNTRYENAQNTCAITTNATGNTQKILDKLCQMEANAKDAEIAHLRQELANASLASAMRPSPVPAYLVSSPYTSNCGCGV